MLRDTNAIFGYFLEWRLRQIFRIILLVVRSSSKQLIDGMDIDEKVWKQNILASIPEKLSFALNLIAEKASHFTHYSTLRSVRDFSKLRVATMFVQKLCTVKEWKTDNTWDNRTR